MDEISVSQGLINIQEQSTIPYKILIRFSEDPSLLKTYIERYGIKFYQQCIFSLTHMSTSDFLSEQMWNKIVEHRLELNIILKDEALRTIGKVLLHSIRSYDTACRYDGEELIVIMPQTNLNIAVSTAKRICKNIANTDINGKNITVSIGVSEARKSILNSAELLKLADDALYKAKIQGKNQVFYI